MADRASFLCSKDMWTYRATLRVTVISSVDRMCIILSVFDNPLKSGLCSREPHYIDFVSNIELVGIQLKSVVHYLHCHLCKTHISSDFQEFVGFCVDLFLLLSDEYILVLSLARAILHVCIV